MPHLRRVLYLLLLLLAFGSPAQEHTGLTWEVEAPPELDAVARRLRDLDPGRLEDTMRLVGLERAGPPIQVLLAAGDSDLARRTPPWVAGYAMGERGAVVLFPSRTPSYPDSSLEDLLRHEVAHILIARAAGGQPLPRWFHEGVAMATEIGWGLEDWSRATIAVMAGGEVPLAELDRWFTGGTGQVHQAYAVSGSFVRYLLERYGQGTAAAVLAGVAAGQPFDAAFERATGTALARAEAEFWRRQTLWYRWVPALTSTFTLWVGITLLALFAIKRRRERDAALRRMWEEEERRLAEPTSDEPVH
jgi:hypothetical protein